MSDAGDVAAEVRLLVDRWRAARERWQDESARDFEEHHLAPLLAAADDVARSADEALRAALEGARRSGA